MRKTAGHFVLCQSAENIDQRKVALSDGFKEPVFLQESWVLGMADKGKVSMQDDGEETLGHSSEREKRYDGDDRESQKLAAVLNFFGIRLTVASTPASRGEGRSPAVNAAAPARGNLQREGPRRFRYSDRHKCPSHCSAARHRNPL